MQETLEVRIPALGEVPCFSGLSPHILSAVAAATVQKSYEASQVVALAGEPCPGLGIVRTGQIKALRLSATGREQILSILEPGDVFHAASVLAGESTPATLMALTATTVCLVPAEDLDNLQNRYPALTQHIARAMAKRVMQLVELVEDLSLRTVDMRVARQLLEKATDNVLHREAWATQAEISARMGTVTYVINRVLRGFEEEGLIDVTRDRIRILDPEGLAARADYK